MIFIGYSLIQGFWRLWVATPAPSWGFWGCAWHHEAGLKAEGLSTWRGRGLSKSFIIRVIIGVTPFRVLTTLLITYLLSPLPLQVTPETLDPKRTPCGLSSATRLDCPLSEQNPKGPCTQIVYILALKYSLCRYIGPKVFSIWEHGPLGEARDIPIKPYLWIR